MVGLLACFYLDLFLFLDLCPNQIKGAAGGGLQALNLRVHEVGLDPLIDWNDALFLRQQLLRLNHDLPALGFVGRIRGLAFIDQLVERRIGPLAVVIAAVGGEQVQEGDGIGEVGTPARENHVELAVLTAGEPGLKGYRRNRHLKTREILF